MLFLDGVYVEYPDSSLRFFWVKAPTSEEIARLTASAQQKIRAEGTETFQWDKGSFFATLNEKAGPQNVEVARKLLHWAKQRKLPIYWGQGKVCGSWSPRVIRDGLRHQLFAVNSTGQVWLYFKALARKRPLWIGVGSIRQSASKSDP